MKERFAHIPEHILYDDRLGGSEKIIMGYIHGMGDNGCFVGNTELGRMASLSSYRVSKVISRLEDMGLVRITNAQSKYRRIYFIQNDKVENDSTLAQMGSTLAQNDSTLAQMGSYYVQNDKHNLKKQSKEPKIITKGQSHGRSSSSDGRRITPSQPNHPEETAGEPVEQTASGTEDDHGFNIIHADES